MKFLTTLISVLFFVFGLSGKDTNYTASTPAAGLVRKFLGISQTDSIDFIRWKLSLNDLRFTLECNYGIGKPNTNGFYNGGKKVAFSGIVERVNHHYLLHHGKQVLKLVELNNNLLHILSSDNSLLIGNGGWSYAINNIKPSANDQNHLSAKLSRVNDSIGFAGRTPCGVPGIIEPGKECYKLKWYLVLYGDPATNKPTKYRLLGTGFRAEGGRKGSWTISNRNGKIVYQLNDEKGNAFIRLLKLDDGVLIFIDRAGNLLVGDLDFSYTLNREF